MLAPGLMAASGFAGLGYQIVWTHQASVWLGHEWPAVLAVVAAFFGGLALGAAALGTRIDRSRVPARWYAACEATIGAWGIALAYLMAPAGEWLLQQIGEQPTAPWQWSVAFCGMFLLLLPATAAMGATLPALERVVREKGARLLLPLLPMSPQTSPGPSSQGLLSHSSVDAPGDAGAGTQGGQQRSSIAALYAANTLGAVAGVLAVAFWLVPAVGLATTAFICAGINLACAGAALWLGAACVATAALPAHGSATTQTLAPPQPALALLAITGLLGIGYEVLVVRVLSQVAENTVYTFAMLLAVYLVGTALGAAAYQRWQSSLSGHRDPAGTLLCLLAGACLLGTAALGSADAGKHWLLDAFGPGMTAALAAEALLALAAFLLPTLVMGALFSHLCTQAQRAGIGFGRAIGVNTVGAALAPLLFGVLLVPAIGSKAALLLVASGYLALAVLRSAPTLYGSAVAAAIIALALFAPPLASVDVPPGGRIVHYREGAAGSVSVVTDAAGVSSLRIDNRQQEGSSATRFSDSRQALLPVLLHPAPKRALFLGLGTGVTAAAATDDPLLQVDAVELLPEVIEASKLFRREGPDAAPNPRLHLMAADARRFVRASTRQYDVIVSDNFHPARSGSGALYTVEHFTAIRQRLAADGVFCQWLPLHQLDRETLRSIVRTFVEVFPDGWAMLATNSLDTPVIGLVARNGTGRFDLAQIRARLLSAAIPMATAGAGIEDEFALLGSFIAGPRSLAAFASGAPVNTDNHPVVAYLAPRITYAPDSLPRDRLIGLLSELRIKPGDLIDGAVPDDAGPRLAAYWSARDRFIEAGRNVRPSGDVQRMLAQVRAPLLEALRISPDFRPAYDPLLQMAAALGSVDQSAARTLLDELQRLQPARLEAAQALRDLPGA
jgi:spermidine synthase